MFFKNEQNPSVTPQELSSVLNNLDAQRELVMRQLKDGTISEKQAREDLERLSLSMSGFRKNLESALDSQQPQDAPKIG